MELPKDPFILYSMINMKLRDAYPSLSELCESEGIDRKQLEATLKANGFVYDPATNSFS